MNYILNQYTNEYEIGDPYDLFSPKDKTAIERAIEIVKVSMESEKVVKEG